MPQPATGILTFLFTDIEGSTARWDTQREAMAAALVRHDTLLRGAIEGRGGTVFKTVGDAFCAVFGDAEAALGAALDAQRALAAEAWSAFGTEFADLRVRMGLHTGKADERGGDYFGPALNRTARLMSAGHGGQVLLSRATEELAADQLPPGSRLRDLGEHRLKDLRHSERIYQLVVEGLRDVVKAPRTAEALDARDRIIVSDPNAAEGAEDEGSQAVVVQRDVPETLAAILAVIRGDARSLVLTVPQVIAAARHRPADVTAYRLGRIAEWSQPRYRLDGRFVALTLLIDQGEDAAGGRWAAKEQAYDDLGALLANTPDPAVVVLGPPGAGKSTLLRRLELDAAIAGLRGEGAKGGSAGGAGDGSAGDSVGGEGTVTFFIQLNQYKPERPGAPPPVPGDWLAAEWAGRYPDLPSLDALLSEGRMILLLDALNEMPAASEREYRERVGLWKDWLLRLTQTRPGNRVVFSCRALDYSAPLSTPALRVPQVQIEPLTDAQVKAFLRAYSPVRGAEIWAAIQSSPQLEALRAPFFLALVVEQVEATGDLAEDRAGIFTGFVRQALRREVERDNPLFALEELLSSRDLRRITQWQWKDGYELPERGRLFPKLGSLAYGMQEAASDGGASQVRLDLDAAMDLLDSPSDEDIVKAGLAIAVLDEDPAADELLYRHQLLQEYFAARILSRQPKPELVAAPWRAADISPTVGELLSSLSPADSLPPLPQTGWEETTILAAAMTEDKEAFVRALLPHSLTVAGRAAATPAVRVQLSAGLLDEIRWALVDRSRDGEADLRARIAASLILGDLGDPRFERAVGPSGEYLLPSMVDVPGGVYPIGDDETITWDNRGTPFTTTAHVPAHHLEIPAFRIGQFPVTNAEWACFMAAGGYDDERWWDTEDGRRWRRGEMANEGGKANSRFWRKRYATEEGLFERMETDGGFANAAAVDRWKLWMTLGDAAFEAAIDLHWRPQRQVEPLFWGDARLNAASQPVVGVCWYEARAYCAWLSAQTGLAFSLPTEVQWEAAIRGAQAYDYPWGDDFEPTRANTFETRIRRTTPIGAFPESDSASGAADGAGNAYEWTNSLWGATVAVDTEDPEFSYPYAPDDGRENFEAPPSAARVVRGGAWGYDHRAARASYRYGFPPDNRSNNQGFRLVMSSPNAPVPLAAGAA
jgi:formylglycine-generating enzyme required for sulfatase activity/class 3 adenylate cyclase